MLIDDAPKGADGDRDREHGRTLVRKAAELGHPDAARKLGDWYAKGERVETDEREAG